MDGLQAALTQLVPNSEFAPGEMAGIRNELVKKVVQWASGELRKAPSQMVVRDIRPASDLSATYEDWSGVTGTTVDAYESLTTGTNSSERWIAFYGVTIMEDTPCSMLKFNIGGGDRAIWNIDGLKSHDDWTGVSPAGVVIPPSMPFVISRYVRQVTSSARIVLKGFVVEPRGKVISP